MEVSTSGDTVDQTPSLRLSSIISIQSVTFLFAFLKAMCDHLRSVGERGEVVHRSESGSQDALELGRWVAPSGSIQISHHFAVLPLPTYV